MSLNHLSLKRKKDVTPLSLPNPQATSARHFLIMTQLCLLKRQLVELVRLLSQLSISAAVIDIH
jgi:hypothetical protein